jgi:GT2 family glycosyltransferase
MKFTDSFLGRLLLKMMPKGGASILLDIDLSTVLERRSDIEYSYDEIRNAIGLYRTLTRKMKSVSLDTVTLTVEQTKKRVLELLFVTELMPKVPIEHAITLDFSIVIPTVNRPMKLKALLESILGQEILPKEITIMDQSDNRLTFNIVNEMKQSFLDRKILLRYFHINQKSSSKARNLGIDHSTTEIVFFIDDDVILSTDYTKNILKVYESFSDAVGVQGIILDPEPSWNLTSTEGRLENQLKKAFFLSHYQENTWTIMPSINDAFSFPLTTVVSTQRMQGCCSFRRKLLDIFRYDENLEGWSFLEDFDLSYRIYKSNIGSLYVTPEAKIIHKEHIHMSYSLKNESYKKIVNRTYMFFKLIKQTPCNCAIFCWSILGFLLTTTLGTILGRKKEKNRWIPIYLIGAAFYSLRHLKEIRQLNLSFLSNVQ